MPDPLKRTLTALAQLSHSDRNAILSKLSPEERELLTKLSTPSAKPPTTPATSSRPSLPQCSPWLAKRLVQLLEERSGAGATDATRHALREILSGAGG